MRASMIHGKLFFNKPLHAQDPSIVHRDIKPANIIVPIGGGEAMLADFGSAKEYVTGIGTTLLSRRSPGYAALEQYRGGTNPSTDIYGLGATLYALLTGSVPIDAPSRIVEIVSKGVDPLKPTSMLNPAIPYTASEAIQRAMSIRDADRFETIEDFWQALVTPGPLQIPAAIPVDLPQQFSPRPKKWSALSTFAILLVIFMSVIGFLCYLPGLTILFFCCLGVILLALALLLYDLFLRAYTPRNSECSQDNELE
jgi:serine/threonine protein kinase